MFAENTKNEECSIPVNVVPTNGSNRSSQENGILTAGRSQEESKPLVSTEEDNSENPAVGTSSVSEGELTSAGPGVAAVQGGNGGTNESAPLSLAKFNVLQFKNSFLEMVEEVRMRRVIDAENEKRIEQLVTEKHDLQQKLEEECTRYNNIIEGHSRQEQEIRKVYEEKLKQVEVEKAKRDLSADCWEQELKALKDEIRNLHLAKYTLEKKVQEQERQLLVQNSSRDSYLSKINQLEEECASASTKVEVVVEHLERLEANVKGAQELHKKLKYVNEHQKCELEHCRRQLESCRGELMDTRVQLATSQREEGSQNGAEEYAVKLRSTEQELKLQVEINKQIQSQLLRLRDEHRTVLQQLKEAHILIEKHIESSAKLGASEMLMQEEVSELRAKMEETENKLKVSVDAHQSLKEQFAQEKEESKRNGEDVANRLKTLQSDYIVLQDTHHDLIEAKSAAERELRAKIEEMTAEKEVLMGSLEKAQEAAQQMKLSQEQRWSERAGQLQAALEQSEAILAEKERALEEKTKECSRFEVQLKEQRQFLNTVSLTETSTSIEARDLEPPTDDPKEVSNEPLEETRDGHTMSVVVPEPSTSLSQPLDPVPELILSPDVISSSPAQKNHHVTHQEQNSMEVDLVVCTSRTPSSSQSEVKMVSPKLCLQRLPLRVPARLPTEKKRARSPPPPPPSVQDTITHTEHSGAAEVSNTVEDFDDVCESPPKRPRIEPHCHDEAKDNVQGLNKAECVVASELEIRTKSIMSQLRRTATNPSSKQLNDHQPRSSKSSASDNIIPTSSILVEADSDERRDTKNQSPGKGVDHQQMSHPTLVFSEEEEEEEENSEDGNEFGSFGRDDGGMVNTQISKQIDKVQVFLKMDRLRRPKKR